jgi:alpha-ketoglutarate-dependent sulfate ester dioxygenase
VSETRERTAFASTLNFYAYLLQQEKDYLGPLQAVHSVAGSRRRVVPDPTPSKKPTGPGWAAAGTRSSGVIGRDVRRW